MIVTAFIQLLGLLSDNSTVPFSHINLGVSFTALGLDGASESEAAPSVTYIPFAEISVIASKFIPLTNSIEINRSRVKQVVLTGSGEDTILTKVVVFLAEGRSLRLYALEGRLKPGGKKFSSFDGGDGAHIDRIEIGSLTPRLIGPRGGITIGLTELNGK
jgi:hypothetical protein